MCWVQNFAEVSNNYELFDKVLHELTKPKPKPRELVANWQMLPPDVVNIVLELLEQYNYQFYTNNFVRIDKIQNSYIVTTPHFDGAWLERRWVRFVGTPPVDTSSKFITTEMVLHKQSLPFAIQYIAQELEKRRQRSGDGVIKPSKMKCKYVKNIVQHCYIGAINTMRWGKLFEYGCSPQNLGKTTIEAGQENLQWILDHE
jgi:hypothetical protein